MTTHTQDKYRPTFHYALQRGWLNDPNGMVYFNGEYHLFYQNHPDGTTWGPMHWGHAVSKDMIHWEELPIALFPDENGAIFSGSAVVDWHNTTGFFDKEPGLVAIFTHHYVDPETEKVRQSQSLAYSKDSGRSWVKYEGNPVLKNEALVDFRDPKVFYHEESKKWVMVLATDQTISFYTSSNLKEWEFASEFGEGQGSHIAVWECPDLFKLPVTNDSSEEKWVLLVSIGDNHQYEEGSRTQYFIGHFDGKTFVNENDPSTVLLLDYGRDNYAGVSWSDIPKEDGRRIYIGWMSNWRYANQVPADVFRGSMTIPRELSLKKTDEGIQLVQTPVTEIKDVRNKKQTIQPTVIDEANSLDVPIGKVAFEVNMELKAVDAKEFGVVIHHNQEEQTSVLYSVVDKEIVLDRTNSGEAAFSPSFPALQKAPLSLDNGKVNLQVFVDTSSIELFLNNGEVAFTSLIYPKTGVESISIFTIDGQLEVLQLDWFELNSIWK